MKSKQLSLVFYQSRGLHTFYYVSLPLLFWGTFSLVMRNSFFNILMALRMFYPGVNLYLCFFERRIDDFLFQRHPTDLILDSRLHILFPQNLQPW